MDSTKPPSIEDHKIVFDDKDLTDLYNVHQVNGQLLATCNNFDLGNPKRSTEIFIKMLPRDCLIQEIFKFVHKCGRIAQIRLLMDFSGYNRGFCFVSFFDAFASRKAMILLNGMEIRDGHSVIVKLSLDNSQLLMTGVPDYLTYSNVTEQLHFLHGLKAATYAGNTPHNTCSYLLHFNSHKSAVESRKLIWPRIRLFNTEVRVDWAVPKLVRKRVKIHFYNMPRNFSRLHIFQLINSHVDILKIVSFDQMNSKGIIGFVNEAAAEEALPHLNSLTLKYMIHFNIVRKEHRNEFVKMNKHKNQLVPSRQQHNSGSNSVSITNNTSIAASRSLQFQENSLLTDEYSCSSTSSSVVSNYSSENPFPNNFLTRHVNTPTTMFNFATVYENMNYFGFMNPLNNVETNVTVSFLQPFESNINGTWSNGYNTY